ncbi:MAG: NAD(P)/FAD-dependent oxidoreductase [Clostridiaceae bacterium]
MDGRYDIAIIGTGPAGLSAAINAKIRNKKYIIFGSRELSAKIIKAPKVNNYLGLPKITGIELKEAFQKHIEEMDIKITYERVNNVYAMGDYYSIMVNDKIYEATTVILTTGVEFSKAINGEEQYLGRGVGYCATCDAPLYKGKKVAIIGYNKEGEDEANYVSELASKVYYIPMYKGQYNLSPGIEIVDDIPEEIVGDSKVQKIKLKNRELEADGVFFLRDAVSPAHLVPGLSMENDHIKVERDMSTNLKGCFAAGDCVGVPYQYLKAAGEGLIAALSAVSYIDKIKK